MKISGIMSPKKNSSSSKICCFCNLSENNELEFGKFFEHNGISTHYYCLLLSSNMEQKGEDEDGILGFLTEDIEREVRRGKRLVCSYCKKIGATLGCCNPKCKRIFHFPCGLKAGSLHQFFGEFRSYCINHRPKQAVDSHILEELNSIDNLLCYICYDKVNHNDHINTLWAPCCKKDAWFHRECVQQLALSAGYFFRCPLCNNKKEFLKVMQEHGIFVPSQDASWELVPNAFEELLYRHDQCDAELCQCPKGRKYTSNNAKWELILCRTCGSQGTHMACGQLKWANPIWDCGECTSILCNAKKNANENVKSNSSNSSSLKDSDLDSDTDISVGTEFPIPCSSLDFNLSRSSSSSSLSDVAEVKLRPGPRSFKLQQQIKAQLKESLKLTCPDLKENEINYTINAENDNLLLKNGTIKKKSSVNKESISQQRSKENDMQKNAKHDSQQERKSSISKINNEKSTQRKADHIEIMIETDDDDVANDNDDDEVKIISLKQDSTSSLQRLNKSLNKSLTNNSISKDSNAALINFPETSNIHQQKKPNVSKTKSKRASIILEQSDTILSQESMPNPFPFNSKKSNTDIVDIDKSSIMNIKITNVTSLSPEVFESVPDVIRENVTIKNFVEESISSKRKIFKNCVRSLKRNIHEANNIASNSHKKNKGNNLGKNYLKENSMKSCITALHMDTRQNRETSPIISGEIREDASEDDPLQYMSTSDRIFNLPLDISQKKDSSTQSLFKACEIDNSLLNIQKNDPSPSYLFKKNKKHTNKIKSRHSEEGSTSYVQSSKENLMNKTTNTDSGIIKCSNQFPSVNFDLYRNLSKPGSIINFTNTQDTRNNEAIVMHGEQTSIITLPQTINNTTMINNNQPTFAHHIPFCVPQTIDPIIFAGNSDQIEVLNNITLAKEKLITPVLISSSGHEASNKILCDGDAGTSRAETKLRCRRKRRLPSECNKSIHTNDDNDSQNLTTRNIFLQVTNNHNTCHQPRLIPQYMDLSDLKFRASESDNVQMILYDTFSVNIPVKNPKKSDKKSTNSSKEYTLISRKRDEASCSIDYIAEQHIDKLRRSLMNENNLINDKIKYITHNCDDAKENLDPIKSKTLSCNDIFNNSTLMNDNDDITLTDYVCENNNEIRFISSDTNLSTPKRICNTNIDNVADDTKLRNNCNQTSLNFVNFKDIDQISSNTISESREEKIANDRSFYKETNKAECSIDLDLNNKSIEKILQNNITFSMNKYIDDDKEIRHNYTSDSILKNNEYLNNVDNMKLRARNRNITRTNIMYNEHVLNKQTDGRFIQCKMFRENIENCNSKNNTKHKITKNTKHHGSCFKISIDLCKIQNFIDTKPDLFKKEA